MKYILFLLLPLFTVANASAQSPIRQGLGLSNEQLPTFTDEALLSAIKYSVENSGVNPIHKINVGAQKHQFFVNVKGPKNSAEFLCSATACEKSNLPESSKLLIAQTEVPFGNVKAYGFKNQTDAFEMGTMGWIAVSVVGYYAVKKVVNRLFTGKWLARNDDHSHFFLSPQEMKEDMELNQKILERAENKMEQDIQQLTAPLIRAASCGHHHHHHGDQDHHQHSEHHACKGLTEAQIEAAQKTLLVGVTKFTLTLMKDFYSEVFAPIVDLGRAFMDPFKRRQMYSFAELVSLRMLKERGVGPAITSIAFIATAEAVYETFESAIMPAGAHVACTIGNVAILGVAASAYTAYFCLRETSVLKDMSLMERFNVAGRVSRVQWRANYGLQAKSEGLNEGEKVALAMNVIFRLVERDVRHALDLQQIDRSSGRDYSRQLGNLKRELNLLALKGSMNPLEMSEVNNWVTRLAQVRNSLNPKPSNAFKCEAILDAAAS